LITGSSGLLGTELIKIASKDESIEIVEFNSISNPRSLCNVSDCFEALENIDGVIHLAAIMENANMDFDQYYDVNVLGTKVLRQEALRRNIKPFIFISSINVYDHSRMPYDGFKEESATNPLTNYSKSKLLAENELLYLDNKGLLILRVSNLIGNRLHPGSLFSGIIEEAINKKIIYVYGKGNRLYDFVSTKYVSKIILDGIRSQITGLYNVGCGLGTSVLWIAKEIKKLTSFEIIYINENKEKIDAYMNCSKIELVTNIPRDKRRYIISNILDQYNLLQEIKS
tara:strand:+ start:211 stop:1062 length:852 start_codon:yes stop_codon:yes gene_type:complete